MLRVACRRSTSWLAFAPARAPLRARICAQALSGSGSRCSLRPDELRSATADPRVSAAGKPVTRAALPLLSLLLAVRARGRAAARDAQGESAGVAPPGALPSLASRRLRPGAPPGLGALP